jgi:(R,R)-butanediol dehydrogenase/meso-butanediol dehydrogenase/diacetyl reductase
MIDPTSMQAIRYYGVRDVRCETVTIGTRAPDEALVAVAWVGLCGSDLEEYLAGPIVTGPPVTLGHEIVGRVAEAASDGSGPPVGATVVVDVVTGCGHCYWCLGHDEGLCPELEVTGLDVDGGLAEYVNARANRLLEVPDGLDPRHAAFAEPTAVAVRAARKLGPVAGRAVLVIGGGTIGLLVAQVLRSQGAERILIVEPNATRRAVAGSLGFDTVWEPSRDARAATIAERFPGRGVDVVIECSGAGGAATEAIGLARRGGDVVLLSVTPNRQEVNTTDVVLSEKTIRGSAAHMWDDDVAPAIRLLASGAIDIEPLITHTFPLDRGVDAFDALAEPSSNAIKILVRTRFAR